MPLLLTQTSGIFVSFLLIAKAFGLCYYQFTVVVKTRLKRAFMDISFKSKKLQAICTNKEKAKAALGTRMAQLLFQRLNEIRAADSVEMLIKYGFGRCHALTGNRSGQFSMDLEHPYRLIFVKVENGLKLVKIVEIVDYH